MADIFKAGGSAGVTPNLAFSDAGVLTVSDGTNSTTITPGAGVATVDLSTTGNTTLGNAAADTVTITGHVDIDSDRTTSGSGLDIDGRINSATAAFSSLDITAVQLTTARTSGSVNGAKLATTSLAGDSGGTYADLRCAAPTDGGGSATHAAIVVEAGHDVLLDLSAAATGESDIVVGDNLANALQIREAANNVMQVATTNGSELVTWGYPFAFAAAAQTIADPGNGQAIPVTRSGVCMITTAGAETRTLAAPTFTGQRLTICMTVDGGDAVIAVTPAFNQTGNNRVTLDDAGDCVELVGVTIAASLTWRLTANDGATLSTV